MRQINNSEQNEGSSFVQNKNVTATAHVELIENVCVFCGSSEYSSRRSS